MWGVRAEVAQVLRATDQNSNGSYSKDHRSASELCSSAVDRSGG